MAKPRPSEVTIAYKAFDPHELLVHFLAVRGGYYEDAGLKPKLLDAAFIPDADLPERTFLVACGSALLSRLAGVPIKIVLVACHKPMFWLRGDPAYRESLRGARIATFPAPAPPAVLLRAMIRGQGLDPDTDVELVPSRDDASRLGQVHTGDVDIAVISSGAIGWADQLGAEEIGDVGESVPAPSAGLAALEAQLDSDRALGDAVASVHGRALSALREHATGAQTELTAIFLTTDTEARVLLDRIPGRFSTDGGVASEFIAQAMHALVPEVTRP